MERPSQTRVMDTTQSYLVQAFRLWPMFHLWECLLTQLSTIFNKYRLIDFTQADHDALTLALTYP